MDVLVELNGVLLGEELLQHGLGLGLLLFGQVQSRQRLLAKLALDRHRGNLSGVHHALCVRGEEKFQTCGSAGREPPRRATLTLGTHAGQRPLAVVGALNGDKLQNGLALLVPDNLVVGAALPSRHDGVGSVIRAVAAQQAAASNAAATPRVPAEVQGPG